MNYELAYRIGFHPWEGAEAQPAFVRTISELLADEEDGREPPYGPALDLGCGSAIWGVKLAERGWQVTGVDIVDRALERARERIDQASVEVRLLHADVTDLRAAKIGSNFRLVLDTGTFHGLSDSDRRAMGREVSALAAPDATVLMIAWTPRRRGPLPRGTSREEIEAAFPGWKVTSQRPSGFEAPKPVALLMKPDERWYRLRRD
jgi:SAM-dependent methyltransferase